MKVLTYNIRHGEGMDNKLDLDRIGQVILDSGAGLIGLQEVDRHWSERSNHKDQIRYLADALRMHYVYFPTLDREPLTEGGKRRQYGLAVLSQYPVMSEEKIFLPSGKEQRGLLQVTVDVDGMPIHLFNTHLGLSSEERAVQAEQIVKKAADQTIGSSIIMGDFNAHTNQAEISPFMNAFHEALSEIPDALTFPADKPYTRLDHIFYSEGLILKAVQVMETLASDHLPVFAEFESKKV